MAHTENAVNRLMPKMCVLAATPLTIHFFLKPHLVALSRYFEVTLACNIRKDTYLPPLHLPVRQVAVYMERKISPLRDLWTLFELCRLFHRERFDLVVSVVPKAGLLGMLAAFLLRVPRRVHIFQGEVWASRRGAMRFLLKAMDVLVAHMATHVLAVSASEKLFLEQQGVAPVGKVQVLGAGSICGVDIERFRPDPLVRSRTRAALGIPEKSILCVYLGRLTVDKGVLDLVQAFAVSGATNEDLWLLLVGPDEDNIKTQLPVLVDGAVGQRMLVKEFTQGPEEILAASDFLCLPSYREGFGIVILEAAAVGIPAIGSRIYGITDAIEDGRTGLLVPAGDVHALSEAINHFYNNPIERARLSAAAYDRVKTKFIQKDVVSGYVNFFRKLLSE